MKALQLNTLVGLTLAAALISQPASAQTYASIFGGGNFLSDASNTDATGFDVKSSFDAGFDFGASLGIAFAPSWRAEAEIAFRQNDLDKLTITNDAGLGVAVGLGSLNGLSAAGTGDVGALSFMANLFYDFAASGPFVPYIGAGVGMAQISANELSVLNTQIVDDDDTVFAYQVAAGASYAVMPATSLFLEYRFFGTADPSLHDVTGASFDSEYHSHTVMVGVRFGL